MSISSLERETSLSGGGQGRPRVSPSPRGARSRSRFGRRTRRRPRWRPRSRARCRGGGRSRRRYRAARRHVAREVARDGDLVAFDVRRAGSAVGDRHVALNEDVPLHLACDDDVALPGDAPANACGRPDGARVAEALWVRACAMMRPAVVHRRRRGDSFDCLAAAVPARYGRSTRSIGRRARSAGTSPAADGTRAALEHVVVVGQELPATSTLAPGPLPALSRRASGGCPGCGGYMPGLKSKGQCTYPAYVNSITPPRSAW